MEFINLTLHPIVIEGVGTFPPSGQVARVIKDKCVSAGEIGGVQIRRKIRNGVEGLPKPEDGKVFIVSSMVRYAVPDRTDVFSPDIGPGAVRDKDGTVIAVRGLLGN